MTSDDVFADPAQINLDDSQEIIIYLRALLDLHNLLLNGYDAELNTFVGKLSAHGWGRLQISQFIERSSYYTRYESLIPAPIRERGDRGEWNANYDRWRK